MQGNNMPEFGKSDSGSDQNNSPFNNSQPNNGNQLNSDGQFSSNSQFSSNGSSIEPASGNLNDNPTPYSHSKFSNFPPAPEQTASPQTNTPSKKSFSLFKKSPNSQNQGDINSRLVTLSVALGVIALISVVVTVWLLVNGNKTTKVETPVATTPTKQEEIVSAKTFGFYTNKITNPTQDVIYRLGVHRSNKDGNGVFGAYISTNNSSVDLYIYWQYIADYYGVTSENTERALATISFEKPVVDIVIGETGQYVGGDVLLFLLSDGTVEYMPVVKALQSQDFRSYGQLAGVKDVVKFYHVDAVSDTGDWSGYVTTLAQREDGSILDLQSFMKAVLADTPAQTQ